MEKQTQMMKYFEVTAGPETEYIAIFENTALTITFSNEKASLKKTQICYEEIDDTFIKDFKYADKSVAIEKKEFMKHYNSANSVLDMEAKFNIS